MDCFFTWHIILGVGKSQDLPSKIWQTFGDSLTLFWLGLGNRRMWLTGYRANLRGEINGPLGPTRAHLLLYGLDLLEPHSTCHYNFTAWQLPAHRASANSIEPSRLGPITRVPRTCHSTHEARSRHSRLPPPLHPRRRRPAHRCPRRFFVHALPLLHLFLPLSVFTYQSKINHTTRLPILSMLCMIENFTTTSFSSWRK